MAEGYEQPNEDFQEYPVRTPRTFQGRRVIKIEWEGNSVDAVDGLWVVGRKVRNREEIRIEVLSTDEPVDFAHAAKVAKRAGSGVRWIEPVMLDWVAAAPNDPRFTQQWALDAIRASPGWDVCKGDPDNVLLAILDSGLPLVEGRLCHPDLKDKGRFLLGRNWIDDDEEPMDDNGHGTHVLGIAAAATDNKVGVAGLLWEGTVLIVKTTDSHGQSSSLTLRSGVSQAIAVARERNMRLVINYSAGEVDNHTKRSAIEEAGKADAVFVAAAGNKNGNPIGYPAAYSQTLSHVITVGAVDHELQAAKFSSSGPQMNVVAPGVDILSTMPNYHVRANNEGFHPKYDLMSGTSMAAPFVAALAALIRAKYPDFSAEQVRDRIEETAQSLSPQSADWVGKGLIDVEQALL